jgi:phosphohistidine phosphatase SixA
MSVIDRRTFLSTIAAAGAIEIIGVRAASSGPATIMLIRHAEDGGDVNFHLSPEGAKRAQALPQLFGPRLPKPDIIVATRASKASDRPMETVEPLAKALHLPIDNRFKDDDFETLAHDLLTDERYAGKVVLVCWHHGKLPKLARALGVNDVLRWPNKQFDRVWVIDYSKKGRPRLEDLPQRLMAGDR